MIQPWDLHSVQSSSISLSCRIARTTVIVNTIPIPTTISTTVFNSEWSLLTPNEVSDDSVEEYGAENITL